MQKHLLTSLLKSLTQTLQAQGLWESEPISETIIHRANTEGVPFAYNVMPLEQWLQFIFIPKMETIIESDLPLPASLCLLPVAEQQLGPAHREVLKVISKIDALFAKSPEQI